MPSWPSRIHPATLLILTVTITLAVSPATGVPTAHPERPEGPTAGAHDAELTSHSSSAARAAARAALTRASAETRSMLATAKKQRRDLRAHQRSAQETRLRAHGPTERQLGNALDERITLLNDVEDDVTGEIERLAPGDSDKDGSDPGAGGDRGESADKDRSASRIADRKSDEGTADQRKRRRAKIVSYAKKQKGKPYDWGAEGPSAFDCSGLTMRAWKKAGRDIGRTTYVQWDKGRSIKRRQLERGDLVFRSGQAHVMLYIGKGKVIHAPRSGTSIRIEKLPPHSTLDGYRTYLPGGK